MFDFDNFDLNPQAVVGGGEVTDNDYAPLVNKPKINGHTLIGDKTNVDLDINKIVDIGSGQSTYKTYIIPKIEVEDAITAYNSFLAGTHTIFLWTLYGSPTYLNILSVDEIAGTCSIDVCLHNQFHIMYTWNDETETYCDFEVNENVAQRAVIQTSGDSGTFNSSDMALILNDNANVVIKNNNEYYHLMHDAINYRTFMNTNTPTIETVTHKAIYVNTSPEAVNYGTWSKEEIGA